MFRRFLGFLEDLEGCGKITGFYESFSSFFWIYTFIRIVHKMIILPYSLMVWRWLQMKGLLLVNVSKNIRGYWL